MLQHEQERQTRLNLLPRCICGHWWSF